MNILANDGISPSGKDKLAAAGHTVITDKVEQDQLIDYINSNNIEVILVRSATKVRQDIIDACPGLKMIGRGGVGMDNIDVAYGRDKGLHVFNTPAASSRAVAELVVSSMFSLARFGYLAANEMPETGAEEFKALKKRYAKGVELQGKTLGIIGLGRIGSALAEMAIGLGMHVVASGRSTGTREVTLSLANGTNVAVEIPMIPKEELLKKSDFVSLHMPAQDEYVIAEKEFDLMKESAFLINAARGGVVEENDLIAALDNGKIAAAALDVFENEPTPKKELLVHPKIFSTPHIGAATLSAQDRIGTELADIIIENAG